MAHDIEVTPNDLSTMIEGSKIREPNLIMTNAHHLMWSGTGTSDGGVSLLEFLNRELYSPIPENKLE